MLRELFSLHDPIVTFYNDTAKRACVEIPFDGENNFYVPPKKCFTGIFSKELVSGSISYYFEGEQSVRHILGGRGGISILFKLK